jgi:ribosome maturation factor RimP
MSSIPDMLKEKMKPLISEEGLELVELEFSGAGPASVLRVFVDKAGGVRLDECSSLSRKLGDYLDMENLIPNRYTLEVSSPGLDRPLITSSDFRRKVGEKVRVLLKVPIDGKTEMVGKIGNLKDQSLILLELSGGKQEAGELMIPLDKVAKAKIIF